MIDTNTSTASEISDDLMYRAECGESLALLELCNVLLAAPEKAPGRALNLLVVVWCAKAHTKKTAITPQNCFNSLGFHPVATRIPYKPLPLIENDALPAQVSQTEAKQGRHPMSMFQFLLSDGVLTDNKITTRALQTIGTLLRHRDRATMPSFPKIHLSDKLLRGSFIADLWENGYRDVISKHGYLKSIYEDIEEWHDMGLENRLAFLISEELQRNKHLALALTYRAISATNYPELLFSMAECAEQGFHDKRVYTPWEKSLIEAFSIITGIQVGEKECILFPNLERALKFCEWAKNRGIDNREIEERLKRRRDEQEKEKERRANLSRRWQVVEVVLWVVALLLLLLWMPLVRCAVSTPDTVWLYAGALLALAGLCFPLPLATRTDAGLAMRTGLVRTENALRHLCSFYTIPVVTLCTLFCAVLMVYRGGLEEPHRLALFSTQLSILTFVFIQHSIRLPLPAREEGLLGYFNVERWCIFLLKGVKTTLTRLDAKTWMADILSKSVFIGLTALIFLPETISSVAITLVGYTIKLHALVYTAALVALMQGICCLLRYLGLKTVMPIQFPAIPASETSRKGMMVQGIICVAIFVAAMATAAC